MAERVLAVGLALPALDRDKQEDLVRRVRDRVRRLREHRRRAREHTGNRLDHCDRRVRRKSDQDGLPLGHPSNMPRLWRSS